MKPTYEYRIGDDQYWHSAPDGKFSIVGWGMVHGRITGLPLPVAAPDTPVAPTEKCTGCNGYGMVGNILDSDTCPFCNGIEPVAAPLPAEQPKSTLAQQVAKAQAEMATWSPKVRASVRIEGGDGPAEQVAPELPQDVLAGYTQWMNSSSNYPHANDKRHPYDAFKAGMEFGAARLPPQEPVGAPAEVATDFVIELHRAWSRLSKLAQGGIESSPSPKFREWFGTGWSARQAPDSARDAALEEAAALCDMRAEGYDHGDSAAIHSRACGGMIRALKSGAQEKAK